MVCSGFWGGKGIVAHINPLHWVGAGAEDFFSIYMFIGVSGTHPCSHPVGFFASISRDFYRFLFAFYSHFYSTIHERLGGFFDASLSFSSWNSIPSC